MNKCDIEKRGDAIPYDYENEQRDLRNFVSCMRYINIA